MNDRKKKTLVVGLDAANWEYLNPLLEGGELPAIQRLLKSGVSGTLRSTMPPWTPAAWSSIITGKNPGKHGIFDMLWRRPGTYLFSPANAGVRMGTPFWKRLNEAGFRVGLVNVPFSHPCDGLDGFFVAGFGTPESARDLAYPPRVIKYIQAKFGEYQPEVSGVDLKKLPPSRVFELERAHQARQVQIAVDLAKAYEVDVLVINLMLTDHANHQMPELPQVQEAYRKADEDLNLLLRSFAPDRVLLFSDHGSCRLKGDFLLNVWLRDRGYYLQAQKNRAEQSAALNWILIQWLQAHYHLTGFVEKALRRLLRPLLLRGPAPLVKPIWKQIQKTIPYAREHTYLSNEPDYARTEVFPGSVYSGLLYFNLEGRDPSGIVSSDEKQKRSREIARELSEVVDPDTGAPLFTDIYLAEDIYQGAALEHGPDIILDSYDNHWNIRMSETSPEPGSVRSKYFMDASQRKEFGWHTRDGIFIFQGDEFGEGRSSDEYHVMDLPATLLHLYGVPIPEDYDGRVMTEVMKVGARAEPVLFQPGDMPVEKVADHPYSLTEEAEIIDRLRSLGYLD